MPVAGDLVVLPKSDILVESMRPSGPGLVLGPVDLERLPTWKRKAFVGVVDVMWPEGVRPFAAERLKVVTVGGKNNAQ